MSVLQVAMAALLVASIWRAFLGPPPDERDLFVARVWAATALLLYFVGVYALAGGHSAAPLLIAAGVIAICMAYWHARGDDGGGGGGGGEDDGNGPIDWDRFDRARREWDKPRVPA